MNRPSTKTNALAALIATSLAACGGGGDGTDAAASQLAAPQRALASGRATLAGPNFTLALSSEHAVVNQGGRVKIKVSITRSNGFADPVLVSLAGLPQGAKAEPVTIAADATEGELLVRAKATAPHSLPTTATAKGVAGTLKASDQLTVTVRGLPGAVDTSFGGGVVTTPIGIGEDYANAMAVQADGKVLVVGSAAVIGGTRLALMRYLRDGSLDPAFGQGGKVLTMVGTQGEDSGNAIAVQPDGKIVVAGTSYQGATGLDFTLLRYNPDGTLDTTFGNAGMVVVDFAGDTDRAWAVLVQPDGKIVVGGEANVGNQSSGVDFALARFDTRGQPDAGFGAGGKLHTALKSSSGTDVLRALAWQTVGGQPRLLAVGGEGDFLAARYDINGVLDAGFGSGGKVVGMFGSTIGGARSIALLPGGKAVVAGHIGHRFAAAQLTSNGSLDAGFSDNGRFLQALTENWNEANAVVRQSDGKLLIGGWAYPTPGSNGDFAAIRLLANGTPDPGFGQAGVVITPTAPGLKADEGNALVLQADERVPTVRAIHAGEANDSNHDVVLLRYWL